MKRADIADYLGLTIETVCRKMSDFRRASLIEMVTSSRIRLLNENGLRAVAEGRCGPLHCCLALRMRLIGFLLGFLCSD